LCFARKYPYPPHKRLFGLTPTPSYPSGNSSLALKCLAFEMADLLGMFYDLPGEISYPSHLMLLILLAGGMIVSKW